MATRCFGCGAPVPSIDGPTHHYLLSAPGCWAMYGEILAREYGDVRYGSMHRLTVDAYAVQHPGRPSPQTVQSLAVHLASLCLILERGAAPDEATRTMQRMSRRKQRFRWLSPPATLGTVTVADVHVACDAEEHLAAVRRWAESAWTAWAMHHPTVRTWLEWV